MFQITQRHLTAALGIVAVGLTVAISSFSVVRAEIGPDKSKTYNCSSGAACVEGDSSGSKTWGVYGISTSADGVHGETSSANGNSAVAGISTGTSGHANGVYGKSSNGYGVVGDSSASGYSGVYGNSSSRYGVYGKSSSADGVHGETASTNGNSAVAGIATGTSGHANGVLGKSSNGSGVSAYSSANAVYGTSYVSVAEALYAEGDAKSTYIFFGFNLYNNKACSIDQAANLLCDGKIGATSVRERHRNSDGQHVLSYATQSATATIEDVGTARMIGGVANVQIDRAFASVMDRKWYYVFLTPLGDTRGLYVSMKTATAFQIREAARGRSNLEFDYRIVAHPLDADNDRLPAAPEMQIQRAAHH